jgi:hypothetical protein
MTFCRVSAEIQRSRDSNPNETFAQLHKTSNYVIPAKAGIQYYQVISGFRCLSRTPIRDSPE